MANADMLRIEVVYARRDSQHQVTLALPAGTTAGEALKRSRLPERFPEIAAAHFKLGISGRLIPVQQPLHDGERLEIHRPLPTDPKEARRERARRTGRRRR